MTAASAANYFADTYSLMFVLFTFIVLISLLKNLSLSLGQLREVDFGRPVLHSRVQLRSHRREDSEEEASGAQTAQRDYHDREEE